MGGYFIGRPMGPEVDPPRPRRPVPSHDTSHMGWAGDKPTKARVEKGARQKKESKYNP